MRNSRSIEEKVMGGELNEAHINKKWEWRKFIKKKESDGVGGDRLGPGAYTTT